MAYWQSKKETKPYNKRLQGRAFDNQNLLQVWLSCGMDILFIRPFCMYWLPILTGNALTGIMAGKVCADVVFSF
jgi:hypothetical protein